jgi:uncharacterized protein YbcV (DUF1398 family)
MPRFRRVIRWRSKARTQVARLNRKPVEAIFTMSKQEKWAYPKIFDALKDTGVGYYETEVATHDIAYHGSGDAIPEPPPPEFTPLQPSASFDARGVQLAIERNKTKPDYMVFLEEIARAGVVRYRVDMSARGVSYFGAARQAYVEKAPPF